MAGYPPPPYQPPGPPNPNDPNAWKYQRRMLRDQERAQRRMARVQRDLYRAQIRGLRRRSIVGPLLLIAIGIVFLLVQTGRLQVYQLWEWEGRWWPLLLVAVGVLLLAEWIFDQSFHRDGQSPYMRRGIGGGVIAVVILLAVTGALFQKFHEHGRDLLTRHFHLNPDNLDEFMGDRHDSDQSLDRAFPANSSLIITSPRGDVTVSGTSPDGQIHVTLHKQVFVRSDSEADGKAQQLQPQLNSSNDILTLSLPALDGAHADLVVSLPATAPVTIDASRGDVSVTTLKAPLNVTASHGDVELSAITGPVNARINDGSSSFSAHNVTGPITLSGRSHDLTLSDLSGPISLDGEFFGSTHLEHINGPIRIHTSRVDLKLVQLDGDVDISSGSGLTVNQALGPFSLVTRNRNITLERIAGDIDIVNSNGSIDLTSPPPLGKINIANRNGSVNLTLPEHAGFHYAATTTDGDLESDFSRIEQQSGRRHGGTANGTIGTGGPMITVSTSHGDIALRKDNFAPMPPRPPAAPLAPLAPLPPPSSAYSVGDKGSSVSIDKDGVHISDGDDKVVVGKSGVHITAGADGSKVVVGKDGTRFSQSSDGATVYVGKDGTRLKRNVDGSRVYIGGDGTHLAIHVDGSIAYTGRDGTHYTKNVDGSKVYIGPDGSRITIRVDGNTTASGPDEKPLSDSAMRERVHRAEEMVRQATEKGDAELRNQSAAH